ncbi:MAG TPA: thiamine-phosphate kinase [Nocardioidaceae bacterium]|nr:thiamine-phosphate kinase [Nocardioidaceae bacterium]
MTFTSPAANATLADLGEFGLISALKEGFAQGEHVLIGPGDDAALVAVPDGRVLVSTDLLVETRHFRRDWASAVDIGHKAAAQNLSDINAMGGRATALTVGLAAPPDLPVAWALELAGGIAEEATAVEASVVGGDVTRADAVMIAITVLGTCQGDPVRRSGARPGDIVAICGRQGWAAAGLAVLTRGFRSPRVLVEAHRRPQPPYEAGAQAAALGATAMIDLSDGLLGDVGHIAEASGVCIDIESSRLEIAEPLRTVGAALGVEPMDFVLSGGDDYALVAAFPGSVVLPAEWHQIGTVLGLPDGDDQPDGEGKTGAPRESRPGKVTVDTGSYDGPAGHQHFG